jgi:hypothetical protein
LAAHWKKNYAGWTAHVLTPDLKLPGKMRLKESRRVPMWNGPIECRLFRFDMVAGSARGKPGSGRAHRTGQARGVTAASRASPSCWTPTSCSTCLSSTTRLAQPLRKALEAGELDWLATQAMRDELERVLAYPQIVPRLAFYELNALQTCSPPSTSTRA